MKQSIIAILILSASGAAQAAGFSAGAARVDTTPPVFDATADAAAFASCPAALFNGPRPFAFEEPYRDVNGDGKFSYGVIDAGGNPSPDAPEPFCDANANGRWDGIFISGGVDHQAQQVHDAIDVRAIAISDGSKAVVIESVVEQGMFINVIDRIRARARMLRPGISDVIVSATHNESSPDTVGIYGAPNVQGLFGGTSGIDDYYVAFLVEQAAQAAAQAYDAMQPATLWARTFPIPANLKVRLSNNFPTTDDEGKPAAIDPKIRLLQARAADGTPIFSLMNLAAHNQEIGHSDLIGDLSSDWPGFFHRKLETLVPGMAMYLVGENGSEEDPETVPRVSDCGDCYTQAQATGEAFAAAAQQQLALATQLPSGGIVIDRAEFFVPLENNLFLAAAKAGIFGDRETYLGGVAVGRLGTDLKTVVSVVDIGPGLQLLTSPGEAFPALMLGSPWGIEDAGCPSAATPFDPKRDNPPVPTWHAHAPLRLQAGLAQDFIGYMLPAWSFSAIPGVFISSCYNTQDDIDPAGHQHKLETEGVGPTASNRMATQLTAMLDLRPDPAMQIVQGRYLLADGSATRKAAQAVAIWMADAGATALAPGHGQIVALPGIGVFGTQAVSANGRFMDYDGQPQDAAGLSTRGMLVSAPDGTVLKRYYLDLYPSLDAANAGLPGAGSGSTTGSTTGSPTGSTTGTTTGSTTGASAGGSMTGDSGGGALPLQLLFLFALVGAMRLGKP